VGLIPDELKIQVFPCPSCGHFINDELDRCPFCSKKISYAARAHSVAGIQAEKRALSIA